MKKSFATLFSVMIFSATIFISTETSASTVWTEAFCETRDSLDLERKWTGGVIPLAEVQYPPGTRFSRGNDGEIDFCLNGACLTQDSFDLTLSFHIPDGFSFLERTGIALEAWPYLSPGGEGLSETGESGCSASGDLDDLRGNLILSVDMPSGTLVCVVRAGLVIEDPATLPVCATVMQEGLSILQFPGLSIGAYRSAAGMVELSLEISLARASGQRGKPTVAIKTITLGPSG